jgi:hypothetical protein
MSSSENSKLLATAAGAAVAGAALAVAAMKLSTSMNNNSSSSNGISYSYGSSTIGKGMANEEEFTPKALATRTSFIYEDPTTSESTNTLLFPHNHEEKMRRKIMARAAVEEENLAPRRSVTVRVPATSANMGPGCK